MLRGGQRGGEEGGDVRVLHSYQLNLGGEKEREREREFIVLKRMYKGTRWHAYISLRSKLKMTTKLYHPYPFPER